MYAGTLGHAMMHHGRAWSAFDTARHETTIKECERQSVEEQNVEKEKGRKTETTRTTKTHSHIRSLYVYRIH